MKEIHVYPIKSCKGLSVYKWQIGPYGLINDRKWMIIDVENNKNRFITQRQYPSLALIEPSFQGENLSITAPNMPTIRIPLSEKKRKKEPEIQVGIWKDTCRAIDEGDEIAEWLQKFLDRSHIRLVRMPEDHDRKTDKGKLVAFADGYPWLLISNESLKELNSRIKEKTIPMNRFRPNVVVEGVSEPFEEDKWKKISIGNIELFGTKKCTRCKTTTVDQATGAFTGPEPLQTLETFRKGLLEGSKNEVCFGMNMIHEMKTSGKIEIKVGQVVRVIDSF